MRLNQVKALWKSGSPAIAGWLTSADTYGAEIAANAGFDALVLDMQHGMGIGPDRAALWLQAVSASSVTPFVRVPWNRPEYIQWVLDAGALGVIVPLINTRDEASRAGQACRYPPVGYRSAGPNRARLYSGSDYEMSANAEVACLVMVEHIDTVGRIDELCEAPGIDGFYIGPADLALSMGVPPRAYQNDTSHAQACQRVLDAARARGLVAGVHCASPEEAARRFAQGFQLCPVFNDANALQRGAADSLAALKKAQGA